MSWIVDARNTFDVELRHLKDNPHLSGRRFERMIIGIKFADSLIHYVMPDTKTATEFSNALADLIMKRKIEEKKYEQEAPVNLEELEPSDEVDKLPEV